MKSLHARPLALGVVALLLVLFSQVALAELTPRAVVDPKPAGLVVSLGSVAPDAGTAELTVQNHSTVLLTVDGTRSSFITPDGQIHQLSSGISSDFTTPLLPEGSASGTLGNLGALQSGSRLEVRLVWTLGAVVGSATWVWQMEDASAAPQTSSATSTPTTLAPATAQTGTSPSGPAAGADSDYVIGLVAVVAGLVVLALLGWGLWSLLS